MEIKPQWSIETHPLFVKHLGSRVIFLQAQAQLYLRIMPTVLKLGGCSFGARSSSSRLCDMVYCIRPSCLDISFRKAGEISANVCFSISAQWGFGRSSDPDWFVVNHYAVVDCRDDRNSTDQCIKWKDVSVAEWVYPVGAVYADLKCTCSTWRFFSSEQLMRSRSLDQDCCWIQVVVAASY